MNQDLPRSGYLHDTFVSTIDACPLGSVMLKGDLGTLRVSFVRFATDRKSLVVYGSFTPIPRFSYKRVDQPKVLCVVRGSSEFPHGCILLCLVRSRRLGTTPPRRFPHNRVAVSE